MSEIGKKLTVAARPFYSDGASKVYHDAATSWPGLVVGTDVVVKYDVDRDGDVFVAYEHDGRARSAYVNRGVLSPGGDQSTAPAATITRAALLDVLSAVDVGVEQAALLADAAEHRSR